jgi:carboxymethylenebutenolidase
VRRKAMPAFPLARRTCYTAAQEKPAMQTRDITFQAADGHAMRAAIANADGPAKRPGVIVIHEIFGLNDDIRQIAGRVADLGYAAMAPDLYDGYGLKLICVAQTMRSLFRGAGRPFDDLNAARDFLQKQSGVDASRIGAIGFCMGGGFALLYAVRAPLRVTAPFYGEVPKSAGDLKGVCPVVASYGGADGTLRGRAERLEKMLTELGVEHDVKEYAGAGHSFMSHHTGTLATLASYGPMKVGYNPAAAEDSWRRIESFFAKHLGGGRA